MASKNTASIALFLALNLLFFTLIADASVTLPSPPPPKPIPGPSPPPPPPPSCSIDVLKLGVCANVLKGLLNITLGQPPVEPCCSLIKDLADVEAAVCLCTAIKANILGINLNVPISLSLLLNVCSKDLPKDFQCA